MGLGVESRRRWAWALFTLDAWGMSNTSVMALRTIVVWINREFSDKLRISLVIRILGLLPSPKVHVASGFEFIARWVRVKI